MAGVSGARLGVVLRAGPEEEPGWATVTHWPAQGVDEAEMQAFTGAAGDQAETCVQQGEAIRGARTANGIDWCVAVRVTLEGEPGALVLAFFLQNVKEGAAVEALRRLRLLAPLPTLFDLGVNEGAGSLRVVDAPGDVAHLVSPLKRSLRLGRILPQLRPMHFQPKALGALAIGDDFGF